MQKQNQGEQTRNNFFKGIPTLILLIAIITAGVWFYNYSTLKTKCQRQVQYVPAKGPTEGIFSTGRLSPPPPEGAHFSWGGNKFESREATVRGCMRSKKDN